MTPVVFRSLIAAAVLLSAVGCDAQAPAATVPSPSPPPPAPAATTTVVVATASPAPTGAERFPPTPGVPLELNPIINAVLGGDVDTLVRLTRYVSIACGPQQGPGSPPPCPPGLAEGAKVEVFPVATCEGEYRPVGAVRGTYTDLVAAANKRLIGVYRAPRPYLPGVTSDYVAVFSRDAGERTGLGAGIAVRDGRVSGIWFGCNVPPAQIVPSGTDALWLRGAGPMAN